MTSSTQKEHSYITLMRGHYDGVLRSGTDNYGTEYSALWLASIDTLKGGLPDEPLPAKQRVYRLITSPQGSNLYWEQPAVVAAYHLSRLSGDERYARAADDYLRDFLRLCVAPNGLFWWGNHLYYDVVKDEQIHFSGAVHEARPLPCAWEMFWKISPDATEREIRRLGEQHIKDHATGFFDRHAGLTETTPPHIEEKDGAAHKIHPFLEAGGVLVESLCWLAQKTGDADLIETALKCARYSFNHRSEKTGLMRNQPCIRRWDYHAATTEIGLWAGCLLHAAEFADNQELREMARESGAAWLRYGYDSAARRYIGKLNVEDGTRAPNAETVYAPAEYSELWEPLFPTHNYPMSLAESCITLYQQSGDEIFKEAMERWAEIIAQSTPANDGAGAYADQYGRCIHFLSRAAEVFDEPRWKEQARALATEAIAHLHEPQTGMFRGHPGEDRCDSVDGIGILFLALLYLETGDQPDGMGFHF